MLVKPYSTWGGKGFWSVLKKDTFFVVQKASSLSLASCNFRILIAQNNYCIAEAKTEEEITHDFTEVRKLVSRLELNLLGQNDSGATLLTFFQKLSVIDKTSTTSTTANQTQSPDLTSSSGSSDGMFAFLNTSQSPGLSILNGENKQREELSTVMSPPLLQPQSQQQQQLDSSDSSNLELNAIRPIPLQEEENLEDIHIEGLVLKLRKPSAKTEKPKNWLRRWYVLDHGCLFEYEDDIETIIQLCRDNQTNCSTSVEYSSEGSSSSEIGYIPSNILPEVVGYCFTLKQTWNSKVFKFATETIGETVEWISFFDNCTGLSATETKKQSKRGWIFTTNTLNGKWDKRWIEIKDGIIEFHKRTEKGFFPLKGVTIEDRGLDIILKPPTNETNRETLLLRLDITDWSKWLSVLHKTVRLCKKEVNTIEREEIEIRKLIADAIAREQSENHSTTTTTRERSYSQHSTPTISEMSIPIPNPNINQTAKQQPFFIVAIDGGGVRGLMSAIILERIVKEFPDLLDRIELVSGTSNGAILASALAFGKSPSFCRELLEGTSKIIFKAQQTTLASATGVLNHAKFNDKNLHTALECVFGKQILADAKKKLIIPAFLLDNGSSFGHDRSCEVRYFHNLGSSISSQEDTGINSFIVDIVMRSTAAPTYFCSHQNYVDGGMFAQDPSSLALNIVQSRLSKPLNQIVLLSIGTGQVKRYYEDKGDHHNWGYVQWVPKMLNLFWDAMVLKSGAICKELLGNRYWRVSPDLMSDIPLDDPLQLPTLVTCAQKMELGPTFDWIRVNVYGLPPNNLRRNSKSVPVSPISTPKS